MRSYQGWIFAWAGSFSIGATAAEIPADLPVTIQDGASELRELPSSLPEIDTPTPPAAQAPVETAPAPGTDTVQAPEDVPPLTEDDTMNLDETPVAEEPATPPAIAETPPAPLVDEPATAEKPESTAAMISRRKKGAVYRPYFDAKPSWGFQFSGSPQGLGSPFEFANGDEFNVRGFSFAFESQPKFLQHVGMISIGPTFTWYPFSIRDEDSDALDATTGPLDVRAFGAMIRYQAYFMRGQILVPFVGYEWQFVRYKLVTDNQGGTTTDNTTLSGASFGAMLQLQWFEHEAAYSAYQEYGVKRTYLVIESKNLSSSDAFLNTRGRSLWFGLRVEI